MLKEAHRLYEQGWAVHLLRPKSKIPIHKNWSSGPRTPWVKFRDAYKIGMNIGVRLGKASKVDGGYLAVIDVDIKVDDPKSETEVQGKLIELGIPENRIICWSGRGGGSRHYYFVTDKPVSPRRLGQANWNGLVKIPSVKPSKKELRDLSPEQVEAGWRIRPAWEISLMGEGQQVVLPPSIHPDTGEKYDWDFEWHDEVKIPKLHIEGKLISEKIEKEKLETFTPTPVDLWTSGLHEDIISQITEGEGVEDRSAALFGASIAMRKVGFSESQILTVLTDTDNALGNVAYEHAQTTSRRKAAQWILNFTLKKVAREADPRNDFEVIESDDDSEDDTLGFDLSEALPEVPADWKATLERGTGNNPKPKGTLKNVHIIFKNMFPQGLLRRDLFAFRDYYIADAPWGAKKGDAICDDDIATVTLWFAEKFRFEPNDGVLRKAFTIMAVQNAHNPVKEQLDQMPAWDGVPRLDTWLEYNFGATDDSEYLSQVFRKWMYAMVKRIYEPGCKFDWMPIFEGAQGVGKSSFGRLLVGDKWFLDWLPDLKDKDAGLGLQGIWVVEMGELTHLKKEIEPVKAFLTRTIDKARPPFGKYWVERPRQCVFFGTTNKQQYFIDETGNRRFKPVIVGQLNFEKLREDREQLFAEAIHLYREKAEDEKSLNNMEGRAAEYEKHMMPSKLIGDDSDVMRDQIERFLVAQKRSENTAFFNPKKFKILDLWAAQIPDWSWPQIHRNVMFAAKAVTKLGGVRRSLKGSLWWKFPSPPPPKRVK